MMQLTRRKMLSLTAGTAAFAVAAPWIGKAMATPEAAQASLMEFTGGKKPATGRITLTAPEIAENGNTVPISVEVDSPMSDSDYVDSVTLLAEANPNPAVATFHFTPLGGVAAAATRIRLAKTQNVIAVAKMSDGSVYMDQKQVKVTIGGCGG